LRIVRSGHGDVVMQMMDFSLMQLVTTPMPEGTGFSGGVRLTAPSEPRSRLRRDGR
jgi:hypothetical protein